MQDAPVPPAHQRSVRPRATSAGIGPDGLFQDAELRAQIGEVLVALTDHVSE